MVSRMLQSDNIYTVTGNDAENGRSAWWVVRVPPLKKEIFLRAVKSGSLDIADYGTIVESGFGKYSKYYSE